MAESDLGAILDQRRILLCGGSGGVGKTTTAAVLGLLAARRGRRTLVLTIDPARRLAHAMGLETLSATPQSVADAPGLWAMMLDPGRTFDQLIARYARDEAAGAAVLNSPYYQQIAQTVAGSREFMAMEQLEELAQSGDFDLLIVDTPPTQHALDFIDAPRRLMELLDGSGLSLLLRASSVANRLSFGMLNRSQAQFSRLFEKLTGHRLMLDVTEFFHSFGEVVAGFRERAGRLQARLRSADSGFLLVLLPERELMAQAQAYQRRLAQEGMRVDAVIFNQVHRIPAAAAAEELQAAARRTGLPMDLLDRASRCHSSWRQRAVAEALLIDGWPMHGGRPCRQVPRLAGNLSSLADLNALADLLERTEGQQEGFPG